MAFLGLSVFNSVKPRKTKKFSWLNPTKVQLSFTKTWLNFIKSIYQVFLSFSWFFLVKSCFFQGLVYWLNLGFSQFVFCEGYSVKEVYLWSVNIFAEISILYTQPSSKLAFTYASKVP